MAASGKSNSGGSRRNKERSETLFVEMIRNRSSANLRGEKECKQRLRKIGKGGRETARRIWMCWEEVD